MIYLFKFQIIHIFWLIEVYSVTQQVLMTMQLYENVFYSQFGITILIVALIL